MDKVDLSGVYLPDIVVSEGLPLKAHSSRRWAGNTCPQCGESSRDSQKFSVFVSSDDRWRFHCFSCGVYGDSADFLALARKITLGDALRELDKGIRTSVVHKAPAPAAEPARNDKLIEAINVLAEKAFDDSPRSYLRQRRISEDTIDMAIATGQLRMLPRNPAKARDWLLKNLGESLLKEAGLMKEGKWPGMSFKPLLAIERGREGIECRVAEFEYRFAKATRYGHMKWPWYFQHRPEPRTVLVTEGFIDGLSAWQSVREADAIMSVPGVNGWTERWFKVIHERNPASMIAIGFDDDSAGSTATRKLGDVLDGLGIDWTIMEPPIGKDWNDALAATSPFI